MVLFGVSRKMSLRAKVIFWALLPLNLIIATVIDICIRIGDLGEWLRDVWWAHTYHPFVSRLMFGWNRK